MCKFAYLHYGEDCCPDPERPLAAFVHVRMVLFRLCSSRCWSRSGKVVASPSIAPPAGPSVFQAGSLYRLSPALPSASVISLQRFHSSCIPTPLAEDPGPYDRFIVTLIFLDVGLLFMENKRRTTRFPYGRRVGTRVILASFYVRTASRVTAISSRG